MRDKKFIIILILVVVGVGYCTFNAHKSKYESTTEIKQPNPFYSKYAGSYEIKVKNYIDDGYTEVIYLNADGSAKWLFGKKAHKTINVQSSKNGTWYATQNSITISLESTSDPSGTIDETFNLKNNLFISGNRYLARSKLE